MFARQVEIIHAEINLVTVFAGSQGFSVRKATIKYTAADVCGSLRRPRRQL